jgi:hypothetical protein
VIISTSPIDAPTSSGGEPDENKNKEKEISPCQRRSFCVAYLDEN